MENAFGRYDREDVRVILEISMAANEATYQKLEEEPKMVGAFERFNERFLATRDARCKEESRMEGRREGRLEALQAVMERLIAGGMDPAEAARYTDLSK